MPKANIVFAKFHWKSRQGVKILYAEEARQKNFNYAAKDLYDQAGAPVNSRNHSGYTALSLMLAAMFGHAHQVAPLLAHGKDPELKDAQGNTAPILLLCAGFHRHCAEIASYGALTSGPWRIYIRILKVKRWHCQVSTGRHLRM